MNKQEKNIYTDSKNTIAVMSINGIVIISFAALVENTVEVVHCFSLIMICFSNHARRPYVVVLFFRWEFSHLSSSSD